MKNLCNIFYDCMSLVHTEWVYCGHNSHARLADKEIRPNDFHSFIMKKY